MRRVHGGIRVLSRLQRGHRYPCRRSGPSKGDFGATPAAVRTSGPSTQGVSGWVDFVRRRRRADYAASRRSSVTIPPRAAAIRHSVPGDPLCAPIGRAQSRVTKHGLQHDSHLHEREGRADAAARGAPERNPRVGSRAPVEEALRAELERIGIEVGATVHQRDVRDDQRSGGNHHVIQLEVLGGESRGDGKDRP